PPPLHVGDVWSPGNRPHLGADQSPAIRDRKSTRLNSSHVSISYAVFCLKKKKIYMDRRTHVVDCNLDGPLHAAAHARCFAHSSLRQRTLVLCWLDANSHQILTSDPTTPSHYSVFFF